MMILFFFGFLFTGYSQLYTKPELVKTIPRYNGTVEETIYSGYVTVNEEFGRNLFYFLVLAEENPEEKPFVLWLNGGPGCSSGLAFISEQGPYNLYQNGSVLKFPYGLNQFSNVLYVDSPAGVGYSYEVNQTDFEHDMGDAKTIADLYTFLQIFFGQVFPHFATHEFQIWGESYGGHYVPLLADYILEQQEGKNERVKKRYHDPTVKLNLKAIAINNGGYNWENMFNGNIWWMFGHAVVSWVQFQKGLTACSNNFYVNMDKKECGDWVNILMSQRDGLSCLDLDADCYGGVNSSYPGMVIPCWNSQYLDDYFNIQESYDAFHPSQEFFKYTKKWSTCSDEVGKYYNSSENPTVVPQLKNIKSHGIKMLLMNGDVDDDCSSLGNQWTVEEVIGSQEAFPPWYYSYPDTPKQLQIGGFYQKVDNFIFATIRNAGHMVSTTQPYRSYILYKKFFEGTFPN